MSGKLFEFSIFNFIPSGKLLDKELGISAQFDFCSFEFYGSLYAEVCCGIFCYIIRSMSDEFMPFFNGSIFWIGYKNTTTRWSWVSSRSTIRVNDKFHEKRISKKLKDAKFEKLQNIFFMLLKWKRVLNISTNKESNVNWNSMKISKINPTFLKQKIVSFIRVTPSSEIEESGSIQTSNFQE